jgi:hypothetical protein
VCKVQQGEVGGERWVKRAVERGSVASVEQRAARCGTGQDGTGLDRPGQGKRWAERGGARRSNGPMARGLECAQIGTRNGGHERSCRPRS